MLCSKSSSRTYDTTAWTRSTQKHGNILSIPSPTPYLLSFRDYTTHIVSQAVIGYHVFTIISDTPDHYWHSSHIPLTYSGLYALTSNLYIVLFCICVASHLGHDPATHLHYSDNIIAIDIVLSTILLLHLIGLTVPHYSRHRVPFVFPNVT